MSNLSTPADSAPGPSQDFGAQGDTDILVVEGVVEAAQPSLPEPQTSVTQVTEQQVKAFRQPKAVAAQGVEAICQLDASRVSELSMQVLAICSEIHLNRLLQFMVFMLPEFHDLHQGF